MKKPIWITNFKNYEQSLGQSAVDLAKIHQEVADATGKSIAVAVSPMDIYRVAQEVKIPVLSQNIDAVDFGKNTGAILPQGVKRSGGVGTLINHSESRKEEQILAESAGFAQKSGLIRIVCAETPEEVEKLAELAPDFIAFEPPELIGSTTASVATAHPESIARSVRLARGIPLLVGAGVNSVEDVRVSIELGASGFLVATAIVKAADPEAALTELVNAM